MHHYLIAISLLTASTSLPMPSLLAQGPTAVSPADRAALEGSSSTHYPLGRQSTRMQTLHDDVPGGTVLQGHGYRRDAIQVRGGVAPFDVEIEVTVSMSPNTAATASTTFANNHGTNPIVVLPRQTISIAGTDRPAIDPAPEFRLQVPYDVPFVVPQGGGTVCVDVQIFTNSNGGNFSVYLDAHQHYSDGRSKQPAYRFGYGCPAPGSTDDSYARMDMWRLANGTTEFDVTIRDGVADDGTGTAKGFLMLGTDLSSQTWPGRPDCPFWSSSELWFALPGSMSATGDYDDTLANLPLLPPGYRLWCQAGSINLTNVDLAFTDALTFITPPYGALPIPTSRIAHASNVFSPTGTFSYAVPVMAFF